MGLRTGLLSYVKRVSVMNHIIEVEIDDAGIVHPLEPGTHLPPGRALLIWPASEAALGLIMSERSLAEG